MMYIKGLLILILCLLVFWHGSIFLNFSSKEEFNTDKYIAKYTGVEPADYFDRTVSDNHGGFHGDGVMTAVYSFESEPGDRLADAISSATHWQELPLDSAAVRFMSDYFEPDIPVEEIRNGYWFILNEQVEGNARYRSDDIFSGYSTNAKCAVYDADHRILYFKEVDT